MARPASLQKTIPSLAATFARLWPYLRRQRGLILISLVALLFNVAMRLLEPWPLKFLVDAVLIPGRASRVPVPDALREMSPAWLILLTAAAVVAIGSVRALTEYVNRAGFTVISNRVLAQVRVDVYRHLQRLPLSFFSRSRAGDLVARVMTDVAMLRDVAATAALPLAASTLVFAGMWSFMFLLHWKLAAALLVPVAIFWALSTRIGRRIHEAARQQRQREAALASTAAEAIHGIKSVQAMGLQERFAQEFDDASRSSAAADIRGGRLSARLERSTDVLVAIATATVIGFGATLVVRGQMSTGDLLVFLAYLRKAFSPLQDFAKYTARLAKAAAAGERVVHVLDEPIAAPQERPTTPAPPLVGAVRFEEVSFAYGDGRGAASRPVLEGLDFHIEPGECVAVVGPSGIGKSTVADLLMRFYDPQRGRVLIDGRDVREFDVESLRRQIAVVLQETILFAGTIRQNVAAGREDAADDAIAAAVELSRSAEFVDRLPRGVDSELAERGVTLSHGQRQRLAIARAAVRDAPILILDEPTVGLDEENRKAVIDGLLRLRGGRTTLLITHDLDLAATADRVVVLHDGHVAECGTHADLLAAGGRYAALVELQSAAVRTDSAADGSGGARGDDGTASRGAHAAAC